MATNPSKKIILFCLISIASLLCDRLTKNLAKERLDYNEPVSYFHDTFRFHYVENTGAALSMGANLPQPLNFFLLSLVPLSALLALCIYVFLKIRTLNYPRVISFSLIFAGGLGNIIDRILYDRHVTDFLNLGIGELRTGIFNVADMCVTTGVIILFFTYKETKRPEENKRKI